jgi:hypothetical protein
MGCCGPRRYKKDSSFSEEKEAKRLLSVGATRNADRFAQCKGAKVFCFFFSKKKNFLPYPSSITTGT